MAQRSESNCLRRLCCGVWRSIADGVVVRFFVFVIAIWCVFFACFFFCLFCVVCVDDYDMNFLTGFDRFWFGTQTEEGTEKPRRVQFCKSFLRMCRRCCCCHVLMCPEFRIRCSCSVCNFVDTKGLIQKSAPWFFNTCFARGINIIRCFHFK